MYPRIYSKIDMIWKWRLYFSVLGHLLNSGTKIQKYGNNHSQWRQHIRWTKFHGEPNVTWQQRGCLIGHKISRDNKERVWLAACRLSCFFSRNKQVCGSASDGRWVRGSTCTAAKMPKRACPFPETFSSQYKIHVGQQELNNYGVFGNKYRQEIYGKCSLADVLALRLEVSFVCTHCVGAAQRQSNLVTEIRPQSWSISPF